MFVDGEIIGRDVDGPPFTRTAFDLSCPESSLNFLFNAGDGRGTGPGADVLGWPLMEANKSEIWKPGCQFQLHFGLASIHGNVCTNRHYGCERLVILRITHSSILVD